jgi:hypothetical protein
MFQISDIAQIIIAASIIVVWVFRYENVVQEFEKFKLSKLIRNSVGASKISLSTLLVAGIWYPSLVYIPSLLMALLMACAQLAHFRAKNPLIKFVPSFLLLVLSVYVARIHA